MSPERFLYFLLLIVAVVVVVFLGIWAVGELLETDPGFIDLGPHYEEIAG